MKQFKKIYESVFNYDYALIKKIASLPLTTLIPLLVSKIF